MDTIDADIAHAPRPESEAERQARLAVEAAGIAQARASISAGYYATEAEVDAWIDSLGTDHPLPAPYPSQPRPL